MARKRSNGSEKAKALDKGLKSMFRGLEQRPVPEPIRDVVDQLDAAGGRAKPPKPKPER